MTKKQIGTFLKNYPLAKRCFPRGYVDVENVYINVKRMDEEFLLSEDRTLGFYDGAYVIGEDTICDRDEQLFVQTTNNVFIFDTRFSAGNRVVDKINKIKTECIQYAVKKVKRDFYRKSSEWIPGEHPHCKNYLSSEYNITIYLLPKTNQETLKELLDNIGISVLSKIEHHDMG